MSQVPFSTEPKDEDLENLLHAYFQAELPTPWPEMKAPQHSASPAFSSNGKAPVLPMPTRTRTWVRWRSRLALAASVALLAGGTFLMPTPLLRKATSVDTLEVGPGSADTTERRSILDGSFDPSRSKLREAITQPSDGPGGVTVEVISPEHLPGESP